MQILLSLIIHIYIYAGKMNVVWHSKFVVIIGNTFKTMPSLYRSNSISSYNNEFCGDYVAYYNLELQMIKAHSLVQISWWTLTIPSKQVCIVTKHCAVHWSCFCACRHRSLADLDIVTSGCCDWPFHGTYLWHNNFRKCYQQFFSSIIENYY